MDAYLDEIAERLSINELMVLGKLKDYQADAKFKSMRRSLLMEKSNLTVADFRKVINRLEITNFIELVYGQKEHKIYITEFGKYALSKSLQKIEESEQSQQPPATKTRQIKSFSNKGN
jgi:predicted transcriptional regulator